MIVDAICEAVSLKPFEMFFNTKREIRRGRSLFFMNSKELSDNNLMNPWVMNIYEIIVSAIIGNIIALGVLYIFAKMYHVPQKHIDIIPDYSNLYILVYIVLANYFLVYASVPYKFIKDKTSRLVIVNGFLFIGASYGMIAKIFSAISVAIIMYFSDNFSGYQGGSEFFDVRVIVIFLSIFMAFCSLIMEYYSITRNIVSYEQMKHFQVSRVRLRLAAAALYFGPSIIGTLYISYFIGSEYTVSGGYKAKNVFLFSCLIVLGLMLFVYSRNKINILKSSFLVGLVMHLPACETSPGVSGEMIKRCDGYGLSNSAIDVIFKYYNSDCLDNFIVPFIFIYILNSVFCISIISLLDNMKNITVSSFNCLFRVERSR
ncbi:hypothetical protein FH063_006320 [Azospirillum argentinense]|uniref:Uncharacterized protein n=2 Tax=Azospirillum argentinense TaxID=2970906 RepID=A0A5B0KRE0_9PROT|nr:hypothetical protein FH063_006320 [Azospirillum argentinense]